MVHDVASLQLNLINDHRMMFGFLASYVCLVVFFFWEVMSVIGYHQIWMDEEDAKKTAFIEVEP